LGEVKVMTGMAASERGEQIGNGVVSPHREPAYDNLRQSGTIRLDRDRDFSKAAFSWENFGKLSQDGIRRVFEARLQPAHAGLRCGKEQMKALALPGGEYACLALGRGEALSIVRDDTREIGIDKYRIIFGTFRWHAAAAAKPSETPSVTNGKFRALLRFDYFANDWVVAAEDRARDEHEFFSNEVEKFIREIEKRPISF